MSKKIRVIIVDDSMLIREIFSSILSRDPEIDVVATASDAFDAREKIKQHNPDVITLDVEMPKMDGITFLEKIMTLRPMPVVMVSSLTQKGADITFKALEMGAIDCLGKANSASDMEAIAHDLIFKVKAAAKARVKPLTRPAAGAAPASAVPTLHYSGNANKWLIAIGASTGGVEALREVLFRFPANSPPIVITQHMPALFTKPFADRLSKICSIRVQEAADGMPIKAGNAYIAYGGQHLRVRTQGGHYVCSFDDSPLVSGHKPSVDVLFHSVAEVAGERAVGAILTGMGRDGAQGLLAMRNAGAQTIGEAEESCVVYGMPKVALELGAVEKQYSLKHIAAEILRRCM